MIGKLDIIKIAPGVVRSFDGKRAIYTGTAEALIAAGLIEQHQLPGEPGNGRGMCTFDADGQPSAFVPGKGRTVDRTGSKQIVAKPRKNGTVYEVRLVLSAARVAAIEVERGAPAEDGMRVPEAPALMPVASRVWPFPVSVGGYQMEARA